MKPNVSDRSRNMLRKLALAVLLPAMLLNGLWMVCQPQDQDDAFAHSKESADCIRICAALEASLGTICLLFPGRSNVSITVIDYGAAIVPEEILLAPSMAMGEFVEQVPVSYANPSLSGSTPPPRA